MKNINSFFIGKDTSWLKIQIVGYQISSFFEKTGENPGEERKDRSSLAPTAVLRGNYTTFPSHYQIMRTSTSVLKQDGRLKSWRGF